MLIFAYDKLLHFAYDTIAYGFVHKLFYKFRMDIFVNSSFCKVSLRMFKIIINIL